jgi:hypothetical protein
MSDVECDASMVKAFNQTRIPWASYAHNEFSREPIPRRWIQQNSIRSANICMSYLTSWSADFAQSTTFPRGLAYE